MEDKREDATPHHGEERTRQLAREIAEAVGIILVVGLVAAAVQRPSLTEWIVLLVLLPLLGVILGAAWHLVNQWFHPGA